MRLKFPLSLSDDEHYLLKWTYRSECGNIVRHQGMFVTYANGKWRGFAADTVKDAKADGFLKITRSSSKTGHYPKKMFAADYQVDELILTPLGEAMGKACAELAEIYYVLREGTLEYGTLADFGYLEMEWFCLHVGKVKRKLLPRIQEGSRLFFRCKPTKANPDALGVYLPDGDLLGTLRAAEVEPWMLNYVRYRPQQLVVEVNDVGEDEVVGDVVALTPSRKNLGLPEQVSDEALKKALYLW